MNANHRNAQKDLNLRTLKVSLYSTLGFSVAQQSIRRLLLRYSSQFRSLSVRERLLVESNCVALLHSVLLTSLSAYAMLLKKNFQNLEQKKKIEVVKKLNRDSLSISTGYFINDLIISRFEILENPANILHHIFALISINFTTFSSSENNVLKYSSDIMVVEFSTIFLTLMNIMKDLKWLESQLFVHQLVSYSFALTFFLSRICYLPWLMNSLRKRKSFKSASFGARYGLYLNTALQFYWFYLILRKVVRK